MEPLSIQDFGGPLPVWSSSFGPIGPGRVYVGLGPRIEARRNFKWLLI